MNFKNKVLYFVSPNFLDTENKKKTLKKISHVVKGNILDIGCGNKPYYSLFLNVKYDGIELKSNKMSKADFFYDGEILPFNNESYKNICFYQVIYIIKNLDLFFDEVYRVLDKNGYLLFSDSFINSDNFNSHQNRFTEQGIKRILNEKGFEIIEFYKILPGLLSIFNITNMYLMRDILWKTKNIFLKLLLYPFTYGIVIINNFVGYLILRFKKNRTKTSEIYEGFIVLARKYEKN